MIRQDETKSFTDDITSCVRFFDSGASLVVIKVRKLQSPSTPAFNDAKSCEKDEDDGIFSSPERWSYTSTSFFSNAARGLLRCARGLGFKFLGYVLQR